MRYKPNHALLILVLLLGAFTSNAQTNTPLSLSLEDALARAKQNNVNIKNAQLDIDYANTQVDEIKAQGLPQINGSTNFSHSYKVPTSLIPGDFAGQPGTNIPVQFGVPFTMTAGVGVNQLLFDGTFFLGLKAASEFVNISTLSASASEIDVREAVQKAYYMALISEKNLAQLDESLVNIKAMKDETQKLYEAGFSEKLDVDRLTLSVSNIEISINQLKNQAKLAKQMLLNSMGEDVNQTVILTSELPTEASSLEDLGASFNPENRIEMKLMNQQQELNELNLKR
ncbi:MAG: TolC family protein, partial [Bacteroidia bacterium]